MTQLMSKLAADIADVARPHADRHDVEGTFVLHRRERLDAAHHRRHAR